MLTRTLAAAHNTSASRRLLARLPHGTEKIVVIPEADCFARVGGDAVEAALHSGVYCAAGQRTEIPAWRGGRVALIADGTAGQAAVEVHGRTMGDPDVEDADAAILALAPDLWFDTIKRAPYVNNAGEMFLPGRYHHYASETTAAAVPADAAINGRQALAFDDVDDRLLVTGADALTNAASDLTLAVVVNQPADAAGQRYMLYFSAAAGGSSRAQIGVTISGRVLAAGRVLDGDTVSTIQSAVNSVPFGAPYVLVAKFKFLTATVDAWVNGVLVLDDQSLTNGTPGLTSATDSATVAIAQTTLAFTFGEALAFRNASIDVAHLTNTLKKKWAIT